jgi:hypothetical protein
MKISTFLTVFVASFPCGLSFQQPSFTARDQAHKGKEARNEKLTPTTASSLSASPLRAVAESNNDKNSNKNSEAWTKPALHNSPVFRAAAILSVLAATGASSLSPLNSLSAKSLATIHVLSFGTWFGTVVYTTFVAGITMFKNLPRQTFGKLQAKLFPKYFAVCSITLLLQLFTLTKVPALKDSVVVAKRALSAALIMTLLNQFWIEPMTTENMMSRYRLEEEGKTGSDEYKKLKGNFGKIHGVSSLANLISLCGGVAHAVYLAAALA